MIFLFFIHFKVSATLIYNILINTRFILGEKMNDDLLNRLHKIASLLEDNGDEQLAEELHNVFLKVSAKKKKKKSSGKNVPNNPSLWSSCKAQAKAKFDVYPSAYANGWAAKQYKAKGGTWRKEK